MSRALHMGVVASQGVGGGGALAPASTGLQNWWQPSGLTVGASALWVDDGSEGADLTKLSADPIHGTPIDGHTTLDPDALRAMENAATSMTGAREAWIVLRSDDHSVQLAYDAIGGTDRQTFYVDATGDVNANAGSTLASASQFREHGVHLFRVVVDGAGNGEIFLITDTGVSLTTPVASGSIGSGTWDGITLGANNAGSSAWKGDIAELLRYSSAVSAPDALTTATYLLDKYPSAAKRAWTEYTLMCAGDSLTQGASSSSGRSYRGQLREALEAADIEAGVRTAVFRGSTNDRSMDHDGASGETISQIESRMAAAIASHSPDCLILIAGTNDCQDAGYSGVTADADYDALLATIHAADSTLPIVLVKVPPLSNGTHDANADDLNTRIDNDIVPGASSAIYVVDARDHGYTSATTTDGVHPNAAGEQALADAVEAGVRLAVAAGAALPTADLLASFFAHLGVTDDGGTEVTNWADQSGNGNHWEQTTATQRPELDPTAGPEGGPSIAFGSLSADTDGHLDMPTAIRAGTGPVSIYCVLDPATGSTGVIERILQLGTFGLFFTRPTRYTAYDGVGFRSFGAVDEPAAGPQCLTFTAETGASELFKGRSSIGTAAWTETALTTSSALGASAAGAESIDAHITALLIYDAAHDAAQRTAVWDYLDSLYPSAGL